MISGECRVESIPFPAAAGGDCKLSIEGLRLHLDLRILPGAAGSSAAAAAVWRVESASVAWFPLGALRGWPRVAITVGAGAVAVAVWLARSPAPEQIAPPDPVVRPSSGVRNLPASAPGTARLPTAPPSSAPAASAAAAPARPPGQGLAGSVAPRIRVVQPEGARRAVAPDVVPPVVVAPEVVSRGAVPPAVAGPGDAPVLQALQRAPSPNDISAARKPQDGAAGHAPDRSARPLTVASKPAASVPAAPNPDALPAVPSSGASALVAKDASRKPQSSNAASLSSNDMLELFGDTK